MVALVEIAFPRCGADVLLVDEDADVGAAPLAHDHVTDPDLRRVVNAAIRARVGDGPAVVDGRDIGTAVFPDAFLKVYVEATLAERARRRALEAEGPERSGDPAVLARQAERKKILEARAIREAEKQRLKQERLAREAAEKAARDAEEARLRAEAEARAAEEAKVRAAEEAERIALELADEAARKAKRDARYAARKSRVGRTPPGFSAR